MAKSQVFKKTNHAGTVELNMVPMVDVAFLLILFFILTGQIVSANFASMELANPTKSMATKPESKHRPNAVIVNVVCRVNPFSKTAPPEVSLQAKEYSILDKKFLPEETARLTAELKKRFTEAKAQGYKDFYVEIRADRRVAFMNVEPVMKCAAEAGIPKMNLTAMEGIP